MIAPENIIETGALAAVRQKKNPPQSGGH